jgi:predicted ATPase
MMLASSRKMTRPFIRRLSVRGYGCIEREDFVLSPIHAFIGPNDSGKSTVLRAQKIGNPGAILASKYGITHTAAMVQAVGNRKLSDIPDDATSLHTWIGALFRALGVDAPARL